MGEDVLVDNPGEDGLPRLMSIGRAHDTLAFLVNFMWASALITCPRGYYGDRIRPCSCAAFTMTK